MAPIRTGFFYGLVAVVVAVVAEVYFLYLDPAGIPDWILAVVAQYRTRLALAAFLFLAILAALRVRPTLLDPDVPYASLLLRDGALAATVVAVMVGAALFVLMALQATLFADEMRAYAREAAPPIVSYVNEEIEELRQGRIERGDPAGDLPPPAEVGEVEGALEPPALRDLGRSIANSVLRALLLGTVGGMVGLLRGRFGASADAKPREG